MIKQRIKQIISRLSNQTGVYRFYDSLGKLLYIGKATSLLNRVRSYFNGDHDVKTNILVPQIANIEYTVTDTIIEALILEANLIQKYQPPYNIQLKDDKSFAIIGITKETFSRVLLLRPTQKEAANLRYKFGPYTSAESARIALKIIRKIIPYRTNCKISEKYRERGCLDYQIGLCPGPCAGAISASDYRKIINKIILFLKGQKKRLLCQLELEMKAASKKHAFEQAAELRNQVFALRHIQDVALIKNHESSIKNYGTLPKRIEAYDISNIGSSHAVGSMVVISDGQPDKSQYRKFRIKTVDGQNDLAMMTEILLRRFKHSEWPIPDLIIVDGGKTHLNMAIEVFRKYGLKIPIISVAKGPSRKNLDLNASDHGLLTANSYKLRATVRLARDEAHRFAIRYHRERRDRKQNFLPE